MKVTDLQHFLVHAGVGKNLCCVRVDSDTGIYGWGECYTQSDRGLQIVARLIEYKGNSSIRELIGDWVNESDFAVNDSAAHLEVVLGYRRGYFDQMVLWTQKREFNNASRHLRPGALISVRFHQDFCKLRFLRADLGTGDKDFGPDRSCLERFGIKTSFRRRPAGQYGMRLLDKVQDATFRTLPAGASVKRSRTQSAQT